MGAELVGKWLGFRYIFGPWRWMLIVYVVDEANGRIVVVTIEDARMAGAVTASR